MELKTRENLKGQSGTLIRSENDFYFRIKADNDDGFVDLKILHNDLEIVINDKDSQIYETKEGEYILDHSKETLGI